MLPDIRAVIAAIVAAVGLLSAAFGVVATLRVAQQQHAVSFQADLAARGRPAPPASPVPAANAGERMVLIIDTPGPHLATPVSSAPAEDPAPEPVPPAPAIAVQTAPLEPLVLAAALPVDAPQAAPHVGAAQRKPAAEHAQATPLTEAAQPAPPSDPPIGGPLVAEPPRRQAETPRSGAGDDSASRKRAAAEKARKARAARIAKERKAAAKRAAQARRAKQPASPSFGNTNSFGTINQVGGTFRQ
jgi:hypothetical protein